MERVDVKDDLHCSCGSGTRYFDNSVHGKMVDTPKSILNVFSLSSMSPCKSCKREGWSGNAGIGPPHELRSGAPIGAGGTGHFHHQSFNLLDFEFNVIMPFEFAVKCDF